MRIAIVSDIHGNQTAFEAVLKDLKQVSPDLVLHGGDLADSGSSPAEIVDQIRALGWEGVLGNTDEIHTRPESLEEFAMRSSAPGSIWVAIREMAGWTREKLGEERIAWLKVFPRTLVLDSLTLVHASPQDLWSSPIPDSGDAEFQSAYASADSPVVVYGHIHRPFVRRVPHPVRGEIAIVNSGSVGLSYDGDPRASYALIDGARSTIRRVDYDVEKEVRSVIGSGLPHADWIARTLRKSSPQLP